MEKKYEIKTLKQVCNIVNNENIEDLSICFVKWLFSYNAAISEIRKKYPELTDGKLNTEIAEGWFDWIDDGKTDILSHGIINGDTGEVIENELKDKKITTMTKKHAKSELILEQECCNIARQKGLVAVKLEKNKHKGIPDYMFIQEGGKCLFVEFKRPDGRGVASDEQLFWAKFLGYSHRFIDNAEEFEWTIERYFQ